MAKKYYWLKLKTDFFRQRSIKKLKKEEKGDTYIVIYMKMLLLSIENSHKIAFDEEDGSFAEELSLEIDENEDDVRIAIDLFIKYNIIECVDEKECFLPEGEKLTGSESESAERVRKHRAKKKKELLEESEDNKREELNSSEENGENSCNNDTSCNKVVHCNKNVTLEKEKELELEKELEKEIDIDIHTDIDKKVTPAKTKHEKAAGECASTCVDENLSQIVKLYEANIGPIYPAKREWFIEVAEKFEGALFKRAIEICIDKSNVTPSFLKGVLARWEQERIFTLSKLHSKEVEVKNRNNVKQFPLRKDKDYNWNFREKVCKEEIDEAMLSEMRRLEQELELC